MKMPAVFLDRDGTIIEDRGYLSDISEVQLFPETLPALQKLKSRFLLFIITNQSGISKGITTQKQVNSINNYLIETLNDNQIKISDVFVCPHQTDENCNCKKPNPYFIYQAEKLHNIDLTKSYIIGDHPSDVECGLNASITPLYVLTGHGEKHKTELKENTIICDNILIAADHIINKTKLVL